MAKNGLAKAVEEMLEELRDTLVGISGELEKVKRERDDLLEAAKVTRRISAEMTRGSRESTFGLRLYGAVDGPLERAGAPSWEEEREEAAKVD